jgi:hypothetical protein
MSSNCSAVLSVTLSISGHRLDCNEVAEHLRKAGIMSSVMSNTSVVYQNAQYQLEPGCRILVNECDKKTLNHSIWQPIKTMGNLSCAHVHVPGQFSGCIYDYLRDSACPGAKGNEVRD